ncbi:lytic polysaccharide monooxygenase [Burkholderia alba]|uniref:lytic polysaccharide monooxygenase n=1 Tax=Burkholderia alba TaxID=2683677 RepID=UPI002B05BFD3|nr:lytic polysaccharide monooxygenase [Burkholderia alba]
MKSLICTASRHHPARRAATLVTGLTLLAAVGATLAPVRQAAAHGAVGYPIARQYQCRLEEGYWYPEDGSAIPHDDCRAASQSAYPFTQWNEVSANPIGQGDDLAKLKEAVPDGLLCAGGDRQKAGLDVPAASWRKTQIAPRNGQIELVWENTQSHNPARMRVFISKPSYNASQPLRWEDLQQIYDAPAAAPTPANGEGHLPGSIQSFYKLNVTLPPGRTGDAVIYSYWQRKDAGNEGFFNCSDVSIGADQGIASFPWIEDGVLVQRGFAPQAGQQVRFRVMGGADSRGEEVVDVRYPITSKNLESTAWAKQLADQVNAQHGSIVRIGVRSGNAVSYDPANPSANKVWLKQNYSSALSIVGSN